MQGTEYAPLIIAGNEIEIMSWSIRPGLGALDRAPSCGPHKNCQCPMTGQPETQN